jgi:hypothetical protein
MQGRLGGSSTILVAVVAGLLVVGVAGYRFFSPCAGGACSVKAEEAAVTAVADEGYACGMAACPAEVTLANGELPACATACGVKDECKGPCKSANGEVPVAAACGTGCGDKAAGCGDKRVNGDCGEKAAGCGDKAACEGANGAAKSGCGEKAGCDEGNGGAKADCGDKAAKECCPLSQGG